MPPRLPLAALALIVIGSVAFPARAQHDITQVAPAPPGGAGSTPLPNGRRMRRYDIPDLDGARQALGPQLVDGHLPKPLIDYLMKDGQVEQRLSIFEGGLVVVRMTGVGTIQKKMILPPDALKRYLAAAKADTLRDIRQASLSTPEASHRALVRIYSGDSYVERTFHPSAVPPKELGDLVAPLRDLLRAMSEDRGVTSTVAGYEPKPGDELVADDEKTYRVMRIVNPPGVVELRCLDAPTTIYVAKKDLNLFFVGAKPKG
ncbi:MAG: hypothetical protein JO197_11715 [Acidobacteria bacterium]|nr:hypothetical protein [Acidobacteriota bacterium]MBV9476143.1 hypothetical protein [Acidobacteriota bacterium]